MTILLIVVFAACVCFVHFNRYVSNIPRRAPRVGRNDSSIWKGERAYTRYANPTNEREWDANFS